MRQNSKSVTSSSQFLHPTQTTTISNAGESALWRLNEDIIVSPMGHRIHGRSESVTTRHVDLWINQWRFNPNDLQRKSTQLLNDCKDERWIIEASDSNIAQFYGLPIVYQDRIHLRSIVVLSGTPMLDLAKSLRRRDHDFPHRLVSFHMGVLIFGKADVTPMGSTLEV